MRGVFLHINYSHLLVGGYTVEKYVIQGIIVLSNLRPGSTKHFQMITRYPASNLQLVKKKHLDDISAPNLGIYTSNQPCSESVSRIIMCLVTKFAFLPNVLLLDFVHHTVYRTWPWTYSWLCLGFSKSYLTNWGISDYCVGSVIYFFLLLSRELWSPWIINHQRSLLHFRSFIFAFDANSSLCQTL